MSLTGGIGNRGVNPPEPGNIIKGEMKRFDINTGRETSSNNWRRSTIFPWNPSEKLCGIQVLHLFAYKN